MNKRKKRLTFLVACFDCFMMVIKERNALASINNVLIEALFVVISEKQIIYSIVAIIVLGNVVFIFTITIGNRKKTSSRPLTPHTFSLVARPIRGLI